MNVVILKKMRFKIKAISCLLISLVFSTQVFSQTSGETVDSNTSSNLESRARLSFPSRAGSQPGRILLGKVVASIADEPVTSFELGVSREDISQDDLLKFQCIEKEASSLGLKVSEQMVDIYLSRVRAQNSLTEEDFDKLIASKGYSMQAYRAEVKRDILKSQLVAREVVPRIKISDEEILNFITKNSKTSIEPGSKFIRRYDYACNAGFSVGQSQPKFCSPKDETYFKEFRDAVEAKNLNKLRELVTKLQVKVVELGFVKSDELKDEISKLVIHMDSGVSAPFFESGHLRAFQILGVVSEEGRISGTIREDAKKQIISLKLKDAEKEYFDKTLPEKHDLIMIK